VVTDFNPWAVNAQHLSATNSFTVLVDFPPVISLVTVSNSLVTLEWNALCGRTYRLQCLERLSETNWIDVPPDITATTTRATATDTIGSEARRFYRVVLLP
jgi:hypothetical protein